MTWDLVSVFVELLPSEADISLVGDVSLLNSPELLDALFSAVLVLNNVS